MEPLSFTNLFSDILDIGDDAPVDPTDPIIEGFMLAIDSWLEYHQGAANRYQSLR